jgi:SecD/SecF fusion protein
MSRNLIWKFGLIVLLLVMCGFSIYPPEQKCKLGIDLAGGTSLLYQIDTTGMRDLEKRDIATDMIRILHQRVDPGNKRNLVWRPHGSDRIEIQMPLATQQTRQLRQDYLDKLAELEKHNVNLRRVRQAMIVPAEQTEGEYIAGRAREFEELAGGSEERIELLKQLGQASDNLHTANTRQNKALLAKADLDKKLDESKIDQLRVESLFQSWDKLDDPNRIEAVKNLVGDDKDKDKTKKVLIERYIKARGELRDLRNDILKKDEGFAALEKQAWTNLEQANVDLDRLDQFLAAPPVKRNEEMDRLKGDNPEITTLIDDLIVTYDAYDKVRGRLDDPEDLKRLLRGSGVLEFRILPLFSDGILSEGEIKNYLDRLTQFGPKKDIDEKTSSYVWRVVKNQEEFAVRDAVIGEFANVRYVLCSNQPDETMLHATAGDIWRLQNSRLGTDQIGNWAVNFSFNEIGAGMFWRLTKNNLQRPLCILLDDEAISAPNIQVAISRSGQITGRYSQVEAMDLVDKLNAGSLPARLSDEPISVNTIGPTMGRDNLEAGLRAGFYGLLGVAGFMCIYYLIAGSLAAAALFMNMLLVIGVMAFSRATFTMPGMAGLILTIGMAVDANVLIFERIREEQMRGSSIRIAIKNGYDRAFRTIMDANATTFLVALILWVLASEEVKGFALTLMIGIVSSMFTALFMTRMVFDFLTDRKIISKKLLMMQFVGKPNINWLGKRLVFWALSILMVIGGWTIFLSRDESTNSKYSIEFTGGTSIHVVLTPKGADSMFTADELGSLDPDRKMLVLRDKVQQAIRVEAEKIENPLLQAARVQQIGSPERLEFEIVTTETNQTNVTLNFSAENKQTVADIQQALHRAATDIGDRRLESAQVRLLDESAGTFLMVTRQNNVNRISDVVSRAFPVKVNLDLGAGTAMTVAEVQKALRRQAKDINDSILAKAAVQPLDSPGKFLILTRQSSREIISRVLGGAFPQSENTIENTVTYTIETDPIVNNAVRQALGDKLDTLTGLEPTVVTAELITDELIGRKTYLGESRAGVYLKFNFGAGQTETVARLKKRLEQSRYKSEFEQYGHNQFVWFPSDNKTVAEDTQLNGVELAIISDDVIYEGGNEEWISFVANETDRFSEIFKWRTSLPRVTQIDPSVGRKSMNDAMIAMVISLLGIVVYIWVRFGNVRFGMAAVAALVHDVSIAMGLVAASAWLADTSVGAALGIRDFKIDLPMIAAFLTVVGYSLNDTIVVFDRIRENRGKLATLSLNIINDSINQTISRTLLTSMTTLIVLVVMYVWGGAGLRSFNYVMIIGVIVGTYSSIGIAAPLLYGAAAESGKSGGSTRKNNK